MTRAGRARARQLRTGPARARGLPGSLILAVLAAITVLTGCSGAGSSSSRNSGFRGDALNPPVVLPTSGPLVSTTGTTGAIGLRATAKITLLYFGSPTARTSARRRSRTVGQALRESSPAVRDATQVLFVTSDPARDTSPVMKTWLSNFDAGLPNPFLGLTGSVTTIDTLAKHVGIPLEPPVRQKNGSYTVDHGAQVLAFVSGQAHLLWTAGHAGRGLPARSRAAREAGGCDTDASVRMEPCPAPAELRSWLWWPAASLHARRVEALVTPC